MAVSVAMAVLVPVAVFVPVAVPVIMAVSTMALGRGYLLTGMVYNRS